MNYWQFVVIFILQLYFISEIQAQESLASSGGNGSSLSGRVDFTTGQLVYDVTTSSTGNIIKGVQQPFEIFLVTNLKETKNIDVSLDVYPNPASNFIILDIRENNIENFSYRLYDINGKLINETDIFNNQTFIQFEDCEPSEYFLKVFKNDKELKLFKIIKN